MVKLSVDWVVIELAFGSCMTACNSMLSLGCSGCPAAGLVATGVPVTPADPSPDFVSLANLRRFDAWSA